MVQCNKDWAGQVGCSGAGVVGASLKMIMFGVEKTVQTVGNCDW